MKANLTVAPVKRRRLNWNISFEFLATNRGKRSINSGSKSNLGHSIFHPHTPIEGLLLNRPRKQFSTHAPIAKFRLASLLPRKSTLWKDPFRNESF